MAFYISDLSIQLQRFIGLNSYYQLRNLIIFFTLG